MTERRSYELHQRRQIHDHIKTLQSKCENLSKIKDDLTSRLIELDNIVEELIIEKGAEQNEPKTVTDTPHVLQKREYSSASLTKLKSAKNTDLNCNCLPSHHICQKSSDAFKLKLAHSLQEIGPKAEKILEFSEKL